MARLRAGGIFFPYEKGRVDRRVSMATAICFTVVLG